MKSQIRTTPVAYLPGHFCASLAEDTVFCTWKGNIDSTYLLFYFVGPDDPDVIAPEFCRNLAFLEFDFIVDNYEDAHALAKWSWEKFQKQILAFNGDFFLVTDVDLETVKSA